VDKTPAATARSSGGFEPEDRSLVVFVKRLTDPMVVQATLLVSVWLHQVPVNRSILILMILTFALTYPGTLPFRYKQIGLFGRIVSSWFLVVAALTLLGWAIKAQDLLPLEPIVLWAIATPFAVYAVHLLSPYIAPRVFRFQSVASAIVVGVNDTSLSIVSTLNDDPLAGIKVRALFDDRSLDRLPAFKNISLLGDIASVPEYVRANFIGTIYVCLPMTSQPRILKLLDEIRDTTASVYFVPDVFLFDLMQARVDSVGGIPVLAVCESPFHGTVGMMKRWSDIVVSFLAVLLLSPVMICAALAVKFTSAGPILFKQKRYGLDGKEIEVWKFRSMRVHHEQGVLTQATKGDQRLSPVGAFLRKSSIDELPQFFNVLQGRMSVVGPRPHAVSHNEIYRKIISGYMIRHKVKPGITGWAQVNGARGETETVEKMEKRVEYDLHYLRHWSLKFDFIIMFKTVLAVFKAPNAY
jgi:putative colanic acid biosysnthesis UDP-glucose lipid carrier transferase